MGLGDVCITSRSKKLIRSGTAVVLLKVSRLTAGEKIHLVQGENMPNHKDQQKTNSESSMSKSSDQEIGTQGKHGSKMDDDMMNTSGGRKGNFSDKNRGSEEQWSPGSRGALDE